MNNLLQNIAPATALQIRVSDWSNGVLTLAAPLPPNRNDKGSAFAGSVGSLLCLAGWGAITQRLRDEGIHAEVMIVESQTRYLRAACSDLSAAAEAGDIRGLLADLDTKQRGRYQIEAAVYSDDACCATMTASYAVFLRA